ncbi:MAG: type I restriction endonuclease subunit R [Thiotrichaceae bacterium]|nr:type I restriction endonuclease subunit R [Thiotrichaceae bacterium]
MTEQQLEQALIEQLQGLEYQAVKITNEQSLLNNLKTQLEKLNHKALQNTPLSDQEFKQILNHLNTGTIFDRAKILRDQFVLKRPDKNNVWISFISAAKDWCQNHFQVAHQITMKDEHHNRYDVTLLINGLPLVQIELKKRGIEIKEAFNQIRRYKNQSYKIGAGLFEYIQIFIISNGINTKYFTNNKTALTRFEQTFFWTDRDNIQCDDLQQFTDAFLKPCHITKMIGQYTILNETNQMLMIMRPYQIYAVEAIIKQIKNTDQNGYIWHTTGSGKTLTSFKASQIIASNPDVQKILFVVDRKDLDDQTVQEFNKFAKDSVDTTSNTKNLVNQLTNNNKKLIVTTIQKLNRVIQKNTRYYEKIQHLQNQKIIFIFDECHRSQFGTTHQNIKNFFQKAQMFGFTGTPILSKNAKIPLGERPLTTKDIFNKCLHKYLIVDAIRDKNVLGFSIEYIGQYQRSNSTNELDINTSLFDENKASLEDEHRLSKIVDYIQTHHDHKTKSRAFTAMFCVSNVPTLIKYYELFKQQPIEKPLKIATIFSYSANEPPIDDTGTTPEEALELPSDANINPTYRNKLAQYIDDYNQIFSTQHRLTESQSFENYYKNIAANVRKGEIDILLVVNMFLTGFDSPRLNTLYVDKNLKLHGLIQAFSRTNRLFDVKKSHGNIVCFRDLKAATDEAICLFSNKDAKETVEGVLVKSYEEYIQDYNQAVTELQTITPTANSVKHLANEEEQVEFVKRFRTLMRLENILNTFADFSETDLNLSRDESDGFRGEFLELKDRAQTQKDDTSILQQVDFELDLIHRDEINVKYILDLLGQLKTKPEAQEEQLKVIYNLLSNQVQLRNKRPLIEKFMQQIDLKENIFQQFVGFWHDESEQAITGLCSEENLIESKLRESLANYKYTNQPPRTSEIGKMLNFNPSILQRKKITERVRSKIAALIETFIEGMGGVV